MRSVWRVALSNLARKPGQALLVGAVLFLSVLLFFTGVGLMREISGPFEAMFAELRGSHLTLVFDSRIHDSEDVREWWRARPEVESVAPALPAVELGESAFHQGRELSGFLLVVERSLAAGTQDRVRVVDGEIGAVPGHGAVWISSAFAAGGGIAAGDVLEIPAAEGLRPFEVEAVVVDPQFSAPFNGQTRVWIAPGELPFYFQSARLNEVIVGVRLRDPADQDELWSAFVASLGGAFSGNLLGYEGVRSGYVAPYALMAVMLVAFSLLSLLIALFAIYGTITSSILADFKVIGILRAQGFRPADVGRIYQLQYLLLALVAVPLGIAGGVLAVFQSIALLMSTIGSGAESSLLGQCALTFVGFLGLVQLFVWRVAKRAERVRPADAIRYGAEQEAAVSSAGLRVRSMRSLSVPLILAIKSLALQRRRALFLVASVLFATVASSLAVNLDHSFGAMLDDLALFGFDSADVRVRRGGSRFSIKHERFMAAMNQRDDVAAIATWDYVDGIVVDDRGHTQALNGTLIDGDIDGLGFLNLRGRNPVGADEISLAIRTAQRNGKDVGDTFELFLLGQELRFVVTGVYQSINNTGEGFRVRLEAARRASPLYAPSQYGLVLREGVDRAGFIAGLEGEYGETVDAQTGDYFIRGMMDTIMGGMRLTNGFLAAIFLLAASVFIFNSTLMTIAENRRTFGILKTAGMTPAQLRASVVYGVALQAVAGIAAGLGTWWLGAGLFVSALFGAVGLVAFPLQNSVIGTLLLIPAVLGFCLLSAWIPSSRLLRLDPRGLIVE